MHIHTPFFPSHRHRLLLGCYLRHMHTTTPALHCIPYTEHSHADVWWVGSDTHTYIYVHTYTKPLCHDIQPRMILSQLHCADTTATAEQEGEQQASNRSSIRGSIRQHHHTGAAAILAGRQTQCQIRQCKWQAGRQAGNRRYSRQQQQQAAGRSTDFLLRKLPSDGERLQNFPAARPSLSHSSPGPRAKPAP